MGRGWEERGGNSVFAKGGRMGASVGNTGKGGRSVKPPELCGSSCAAYFV
jgi:hypothetical protein